MIHQLNVYLNCHKMGKYLLNLPEQFDMESLRLLQILLASSPNVKEDHIQNYLNYDVFKPDNIIETKHNFKLKFPQCFDPNGFFILVKEVVNHV